MSAERGIINAERGVGASRVVNLVLLTFVLNVGVLADRTVRGDGPTTQPATEFPSASNCNWFNQLADPDPKIRDQAEVELMGMTADDLPAFRRLVESKRPLAPAQAAVLRDIVEQVYLAGEKYKGTDGDTDATGTEGPFFLGVYWPVDFDQNARLGVPIENRMPGFPGFRYLRDGDMILRICVDPALPMFQPPNAETHISRTLINALTLAPLAQSVVLEVLRDGEEIRIPLRLAPRPLDAQATPDSLSAFLSPRAQRAEKYWTDHFLPLVGQEATIDFK